MMGNQGVLIASSRDIVRCGLILIVQKNTKLNIVGEAETLQETLEKVRVFEPLLVIVDSKLKEGTGIEACKIIKANHPEIKVIILSSDADEDTIFSSIIAGANGFLLKDSGASEIVKAVIMVTQGGSFLDPVITKKVMEKMQNMGREPIKKESFLNPQEKRILALIAQGKTNKEIANVLTLSDKTVKNYVSSILSKLNFSNRAEAAAYAVKNNIIIKHRVVE